MRTFVYMNKAGERYAVEHFNERTGAVWEHPYSEREACLVCQGTSTAAPKERTSA